MSRMVGVAGASSVLLLAAPGHRNRWRLPLTCDMARGMAWTFAQRPGVRVYISGGIAYWTHHNGGLQ